MRIAALLVFLLVGCASSPEEIQQTELQKEARYVREEQEIGREIAAKLLGHFGTHEASPATKHYLNLVGKNLAKRWGRPELEYRFGILDSADTNAYATPGGYILVTRGLLAKLRNESELALVLAHEITHVNEKHMFNEIAPRREVSAQETMVRMMSRGGSDIGGSLLQIVNKGLELLLEKGLGKEKELEADQGALHIAAAAGYAPGAYVGLLERLQKEQATLKSIEISVPFAERLEVVRKVISGNGFSNRAVANESVLTGRFERGLASLTASGSR